MSEKKVSDFIILDRIAKECGDEGIAMFPTILKGNLTKKGGEITFGVPTKAMEWTLKGSHHFVLYAVKKVDFSRIQKEFESQSIENREIDLSKLSDNQFRVLMDYYQSILECIE